MGEGVPTLQVLWHLEERGALTQVALAELTGQHAAGISRLLDELEDKALVMRSRSREDRRCVLVSLTKTGRSHYKKLSPAFGDAVKEVLLPLSDAEVKALGHLLRKVTEPR